MTETITPLSLHFFVPGHPAAQGSKRHVGRGILIEQSQNVGPWRERIALAAHRFAITDGIPLPFTNRPLKAVLKFVMPRPASTPKTRRTPPAIKRPDVDKLSRAVLDALTAIIWSDDSAVVELQAFKRIAELEETPGVHITIATLA